MSLSPQGQQGDTRQLEAELLQARRRVAELQEELWRRQGKLGRRVSQPLLLLGWLMGVGLGSVLPYLLSLAGFLPAYRFGYIPWVGFWLLLGPLLVAGLVWAKIRRQMAAAPIGQQQKARASLTEFWVLGRRAFLGALAAGTLLMLALSLA